MTDRKRDPLPEGYQYLDAAKLILAASLLPPLSPERVGEILREMGNWNVIEGDHFTTGRDTGDETTQ